MGFFFFTHDDKFAPVYPDCVNKRPGLAGYNYLIICTRTSIHFVLYDNFLCEMRCKGKSPPINWPLEKSYKSIRKPLETLNVGKLYGESSAFVSLGRNGDRAFVKFDNFFGE